MSSWIFIEIVTECKRINEITGESLDLSFVILDFIYYVSSQTRTTMKSFF